MACSGEQRENDEHISGLLAGVLKDFS